MPSTRDLNSSAESVSLDRGSIPNFDLTPLFSGDGASSETLVPDIRSACLETGFFYVHKTCVSDSTIDGALSAMQGFFALDDRDPVKSAVHNRHAGGMKGWGPMFGEPAYQANTVAHVESFDFGQQLDDERYCELGITPNIWPDLPGFETALLNYYRECTQLGRVLASVFSELLGEDSDFINRISGESAPRTMRMLHYPPTLTPPDERHVGISAHTDFECFTIMNQTAEGLELTDVNGQWCRAPSDLGSFTVILGDMLERFSNGHFKATGHRVASTPWTRHSMVLFFAVDGDFPVAPLPGFVCGENPDRYGSITQDRHIEDELARAAENQSTNTDST